ncbi:50S ribosomal protein L9 [Zavarzinia marina]|uniref:50S ribosomal protein L9 n=1 Tax=Zavarzinia marina TaxID=2911065 RepID=UPI002E378BAF|nr:50S ribosomal protein L9 [Zavarzinia marina]
MEIVLLQRIEKLGQMGDVVRVRDGYARNFLLPQKKALRATKENLARFERDRVHLEARNLELRKEAEAVAEKMDGLSIVMVRQAGDTGQLYGSVSNRDVALAIVEAGFEVDRRQVQLGQPIKVLGVTPVRVTLHPEVAVTVNINVARSAADAELQASTGEAVFENEDEAIVNDEDLLPAAEEEDAL